ncbi:MAG: hypothetical protein ACI81R_001975 [Bradymonadia bacterium]|jgi:hypothetical protein
MSTPNTVTSRPNALLLPPTQRQRATTGAGFSERLSEPRVPSLVGTVVAAVPGPIGELLQAATSSADPQAGSVDAMWEMQREQQLFNMEYLQLQTAMQNDNRHFSTMSNLMKAQHDTAKSAISNIRV